MALPKRLYPLFILLCCLSSCQTVEQISIDYLVPAEVSFPQELRKVGIINNTGDTIARRGSLSDTIGTPPHLTRNIYTGMSSVATESLAEAVAAQNYFDQVIISDSVMHSDIESLKAREFTEGEVKRLCEYLGVDFLFSLESIHLQSTRSVIFSPVFGDFQGTINAKVYPVVKVYLPGRIRPIATITKHDSIYWEKFGRSEEEAKILLPSEERMVYEASQFAGTLSVGQLIPTWQSAARAIYTNGSVELRDAAVYVREKNWDEAATLWQSALQKKSKRLQMAAGCNLALYYEMKDDIDKALIEAQKAKALASGDNLAILTLYTLKLEERLAQQAKLRQQMNRFNNDF